MRFFRSRLSGCFVISSDVDVFFAAAATKTVSIDDGQNAAATEATRDDLSTTQYARTQQSTRVGDFMVDGEQYRFRVFATMKNGKQAMRCSPCRGDACRYCSTSS